MSALVRSPEASQPAPSGRMINALLQYADVQEDLGEGRLRMRLSKGRLRRPEVRAALGRDLDRAGRISVIFDEREAEIVEVANDPEPEAERWMAQLERAYERRSFRR